MCGIVGYVGRREAEPILVEGLRLLEYRGYDSAGLATVTGRQLHLRRRAGRVADLVHYLDEEPAPGCHGISHTRWATHGPATDANAHPHVGGDGLVAVVHNGVSEHERVHAHVQQLDFEAEEADRGVFDHYMLKEIYEQPEALENAMRGRLDDADATSHFGGLNLDPQQLRRAERLILTACGTSYHAALVGEYLFEEFARIPVEVEYASEFRYRNPPIDRNTIVLAITQSGETADTLAAVRESKRKGHPTLALCNVVGSTIAREADGGVYLHAGPEIGVASTKAVTSQVTLLTLLARYLGRMRHLSSLQGARLIRRLRAMPDIIRRTLECHDTVRGIAAKYAHVTNALYMGRQYLYPVALEGALKLKEISYIHAEGYPAAEMKHGPIALVDAETPSVFLAPRGQVLDKVMSNLEEIKARGGPVIAIACEGDEDITAYVKERADEV